MAILKFAPFSTNIHPTFWQELSSLKIDKLQLSDETVQIHANYSAGKVVLDRQTGESVSLGGQIGLDAASLQSTDTSHNSPSISATPLFSTSKQSSTTIKARGSLKNFNTIEAFRNADKQAIFGSTLQSIWKGLSNVEQDPETFLTTFLALTFADLKKYKFYYWFAYPALVTNPAWELTESADGADAWRPIATDLDASQRHAIGTWIQQQTIGQGFFLFKTSNSTDSSVGRISTYSSFFDGVPEKERYIGFVDPSGASQIPGWPLRNFLAYLHARFGIEQAQVICWKDEGGVALTSDRMRSVVGHIHLPTSKDDETPSGLKLEGRRTWLSCKANDDQVPDGVGWERNVQGKLAPKVADLGPLMDPRKLADQAVDLNLKLMRWRIMPEIKLETIQNTRCLLLGAGTLGCYVARALLGWGVRQITFVDSAKVSFSNPVRQPLFDFEDCLEGGRPKAECAAKNLMRIYPGVDAKGVSFSIPMPGHPVPPNSEQQVKADVERLEKLMDEHDVVYLLMDSRESRWLPTLLGAAKSKLVINAALGFDSYLVMRHGAPPKSANEVEAPKQGVDANKSWHGRLGCYFCNDIVAPSDSLTDRTLDQMCTVTRPGLAAIAGASAVELMVSVLQHKLGLDAPATAGESSRQGTEDMQAIANATTVLGIVPHQLRGFLAQFNTLRVVGQAYDRCTGCSASVIEAYRSSGFEMLLQAFKEEKYLEKLTGLDKMYEEAEELEAAFDWDVENDEEGDF
ncbi:probable APG7 - component of the autophagic system [Melanopsichium pennsylvanicum]|uniref:Ubiquitin-like modifier-activating enzyme ATG7 n=2 Tax=Melanopsichium pennsylvanicum TaxID=63383 RepID=A0AAJ4XS59_9BASI|nr:probable APG7-component of the autophagic system [Melanopsichium pennsylvanicum 4]SNX87535.1 probable APG7 - component of the autophagic system [Melanopsichium pennsylvanicum]